jgi:MraZ protein
MLLTGTFHRSLDDKLRFAMPKPLRDAIGHPDQSVVYLAPGTDGTLELYKEVGFTQLAESLQSSPRNAREIRAFNRLFYAQVQRIEMDKHGRVRLPVELASLASLNKEIVLIGVRDHIELWDRRQWDAYLGDTQPHYDELAECVFPAVAGQTNAPVENRKQTTEQVVAGRERPLQPR